MKKFLLLLLLAVTTMAAKADIGEFALGGQAVYGTNNKAPGIGLHMKYNLRYHWRVNWAINYNFKKNGIQSLDGCNDFNYLFYIGDKVRVYPLAGLLLRVWFWQDQYYVATEKYVDREAEGRFGVNGGGGIDYVINDHFIVNAESKYQFLNEDSQVHFSIGVSYLF